MTSQQSSIPAVSTGATALRRRRLKIRFVPTFPAAIVVIAVLIAIFAQQIATHDPRLGELVEANRAPMSPGVAVAGGTHRLGTDPLGRDVFSRMVFGARVSLGVATVVILADTILGGSVGIASGFFGGKVDAVTMRIVDMILSIPLLLVAIVSAITFGASLVSLIILIVAFGWPRYARQIRAEALALREQDFVTLAKVAGVSNLRIMFRHMLPNVVPTMTVLTTLQVGGVILTEAALSFLGVGVPPGTPSWGSMVADGRDQLMVNWWVAVFPGLAITLIVLSMNFLGDWLRDYLDPRMKKMID